MTSKVEKVVETQTAIAIILLTLAIPLVIGVLGATAGIEYESNCSAVRGEKPVCTTRYAYKGLGNLDIPSDSLQAIAGAIGVMFGIYAGLKNGKIPEQLKEILGGEDDLSRPG